MAEEDTGVEALGGSDRATAAAVFCAGLAALEAIALVCVVVVDARFGPSKRGRGGSATSFHKDPSLRKVFGLCLAALVLATLHNLIASAALFLERETTAGAAAGGSDAVVPWVAGMTMLVQSAADVSTGRLHWRAYKRSYLVRGLLGFHRPAWISSMASAVVASVVALDARGTASSSRTKLVMVTWVTSRLVLSMSLALLGWRFHQRSRKTDSLLSSTREESARPRVVDECGLLTLRASEETRRSDFIRRLGEDRDSEDDEDDEEAAARNGYRSGDDEPTGAVFEEWRSAPAGDSFVHLDGEDEPRMMVDEWRFDLLRSAASTTTTDSSSAPGGRKHHPAAAPHHPAQVGEPRSLPLRARCVAWREVAPGASVPVIVYIMLLDDVDLCVHRYGEYRQLCNRVVSKLFYERGAEPPGFPHRRVFRKLLPLAIGGLPSTDFTDSRALALQEWLQQVLDFVHHQDIANSASCPAELSEFLQPLASLQSSSASSSESSPLPDPPFHARAQVVAPGSGSLLDSSGLSDASQQLASQIDLAVSVFVDTTMVRQGYRESGSAATRSPSGQ